MRKGLPARITEVVWMLCLGIGPAGAEPAWAIVYARDANGNLPAPYVAVPNVCAWPNLTVLPDGTIAASIHNQPNHGTTESDLDVWTSVDLGQTWQYAGTPAPHEPSTNRMNHAAGLASNGDLLVMCSGWDLNTGAVLDPWLSRSTDNGQTWTIDKAALPIRSPRGYPVIPYGNIIQGADGVLRAPVYDWPYSPRNERTYFIQSDDGGATWGDFIPLDPGEIRNETTLLNLSGNNWLAVARGLNEDMYSYLSSDNGQTWQSQGLLTGYYKHPGHLMRMADGRVLLTYGNRNGLQGIEVLVSEDEGVSWSEPTRVCDYLGPDGGYPSTVQLPNGQMLTAFYAQGLQSVYDGYLMGAVMWDPSSVPGEEQPPGPPRPKETVGYWRFNEKSPGQQASGTTGAILDNSGHANHGTAEGDPLPLYVNSPHDSPSAICLTEGNAVEDRIVVPHNSDLNFNLRNGDDFTVEAILRTNNPTQWGAIASKRETTGPGWVVRFNTDGEIGIYIQGTEDYTNPDAHGTIDVADGQWHHVAVVVESDSAQPENNKVRIYVDRSLDSEVLLADVSYLGTGIGEDLSNFHDLWMGDFIGRASDQFVGDIDFLRIASGVLTPSEFFPFNQIPGDLNGDGFVGGADLDIVRAHWGQAVLPGLWAQGDPSGDGYVGGGDLDVIRAHWGEGVLPPPGSVPEPSVFSGLLGLLVLGGLARAHWC